MKRSTSQTLVLALSALILAAPAIAYDQQLAAAYAEMFAPVQGAKAGKALHMMKPEQYVKSVKAGKQFVTIDIRTPGETRFFTSNLPGHRLIPLAQLFEPDQLTQLPTDQTIVVLCKSGARATAAVTALRHIGFTDAFVLKGGFKGLVAYLGAKEANQPLGPATAAR